MLGDGCMACEGRGDAHTYDEYCLENEPTALAYTPDDEMERGVEEFKRLWPDKWAAWVAWGGEQGAILYFRARPRISERAREMGVASKDDQFDIETGKRTDDER